MIPGLIELFVKTFTIVLGQRIADKFATSIVCAVAKGCPKKVDKIAGDVKAKQEDKRQIEARRKEKNP